MTTGYCRVVLVAEVIVPDWTPTAISTTRCGLYWQRVEERQPEATGDQSYIYYVEVSRPGTPTAPINRDPGREPDSSVAIDGSSTTFYDASRLRRRQHADLNDSDNPVYARTGFDPGGFDAGMLAPLGDPNLLHGIPGRVAPRRIRWDLTCGIPAGGRYIPMSVRQHSSRLRLRRVRPPVATTGRAALLCDT